jgi:hypothetical protein
MGDRALRPHAALLRPIRLLPQFHRKEADIDAMLRLLNEAAGRPYPVRNVPNTYPKGFDYYRGFERS